MLGSQVVLQFVLLGQIRVVSIKVYNYMCQHGQKGRCVCSDYCVCTPSLEKRNTAPATLEKDNTHGEIS